MFVHQLAIGALHRRRVVGRFYSQHIAGIFEGRPTLRLLPAGVTAMLAIRALLRTAAKLGAALHHPQELIELGAGDAELVGNDEQHFPFVRMQFAISERRLQLNFQKHPNQIETAKADATQLTHFLAQGIVVGLTVAKRLLRRGARGAMQVHAIH